MDRNVGLLVRKHFGRLLSNPKKHILNLSDYSLSDTEEFVLEHGLEFCIPPRDINREETFAEFEILIAKLAVCFEKRVWLTKSPPERFGSRVLWHHHRPH